MSLASKKAPILADLQLDSEEFSWRKKLKLSDGKWTISFNEAELASIDHLLYAGTYKASLLVAVEDFKPLIYELGVIKFNYLNKRDEQEQFVESLIPKQINEPHSKSFLISLFTASSFVPYVLILFLVRKDLISSGQ